MIRVRSLLGSLIILGSVLLAPVSALAFNTRITVYASVPEMRNIYVNKAGLVYKVAGNTTRNIQPQVYDENNKALAMTDSINQQYQRFLSEHNGKLEASKIYIVNPVIVNTTASSQTIKVESSQQQLTLVL